MTPLFTRQHQMDLLQEKLYALASQPVALQKTRREIMRKRLMTRIEHAMEEEVMDFEQLTQELEKLTLTVEPTSRFKLHAKESVLNFLWFKHKRFWLMDFVRDLFSRRRYWATAVACLMLFVSTFAFLVQPPQVSAAKVSWVDEFTGMGSIHRGGQILPLEEGFLIQEGDRLVTGDSGWLRVLFVDDSLLTLGPGTTAHVARLWVDPGNEAHTSVVLDVQQGRVWASVINLLPNGSQLVVTAGQTRFFADQRGQFDVFASPEQTRLRVFSDLVDFSVMAPSVSHQGTLGPDLSLSLISGVLSIDRIEDRETLLREDVWVQSNVQTAEEHRMRLDRLYRERMLEQAGVLPGDLRYQFKRGLEEFRLAFLFDESSRSDWDVALAERRFAEAASLVQRGDVEAARSVFTDYQAAVIQAAGRNVQETAILALLEENKKAAFAASPDQPLYALRHVVDETSLLVAQDASLKQILQLSTTADRLGLALDFIDIGAYELAQTALEDYQLGFEQLLAELPVLDFENRKEVILEILDQKIRDLQRLKLLTGKLEMLQNVDASESQSLLTQLAVLHEDTLYQLNTLVIHLKERAVLHLGTFLEDVKEDRETQLQILNRLKKSVPLDFGTMQLINDLETLYLDDRGEVLHIEEGLRVPHAILNVPFENYRDEQVDSGVSGLKEVKTY